MNKKILIIVSIIFVICITLLAIRSFFHSNLCTADAIDMCNPQEKTIIKKMSSQCGWPAEDVETLKNKGWIYCSDIPNKGADYKYQLPKTMTGNWLTGKQKWVDCGESELGCEFSY